MLCPLKFNGKIADGTGCNYQCEKENCEWWDKESKCCAIKHIRCIDCLVDAICLLSNKNKNEDL